MNADNNSRKVILEVDKKLKSTTLIKLGTSDIIEKTEYVDTKILSYHGYDFVMKTHPPTILLGKMLEVGVSARVTLVRHSINRLAPCFPRLIYNYNVTRGLVSPECFL